VAISVFVLIAIGNAQVAAPGLSEVRVTVVDQVGARIVDSEIVFTADSKTTVFHTGADGSLAVRVPSGTYAIKTTRAGFLTNEIHDFRTGTLQPSELRIVLKFDPDACKKGACLCSGPTCGEPRVVPTTTSDVPQSDSGLALYAAAVSAQQPQDAASTILSPQELPKACSREDVAKYGRPVLFTRRDGLAFGVSAPRDRFKTNEEARVYIWLSNESTAATGLMATCCERTFLDVVEVVDAHGLRLESSPEIFDRKTRQQGRTPVHVCTCSGPLTQYQPGFCGVIDRGTLNRPDTAYDLPPGAYRVEEKTPKPGVDPSRSLFRADMAEKVPALVISIEKP
jgi:hypothetical protein